MNAYQLDQTSHTFDVLVRDGGNLTFRKHLDRLNRRARKLGMAELVITSETAEQMKDKTLAYRYTIEGPRPTVNGWHVAARYANVDGVSQFYTFQDSVPERYRHEGAENCQHCNTNRKRNVVYILNNASEQTFIRVGSTCVDDFVGNASLFALYSDMQEVMGMDWSSDSIGGGRACYTLEEAVMLAVYTFRRDGWNSAMSQFPNKYAMTEYVRGFNFDAADDQLKSETADVLRRLEALDPVSDFDWNLKELAQSDVVTAKHFGFIAYMPVWAERERMKETAEPKKVLEYTSGYAAPVGDKVNAKVTVMKVVDVQGYYGNTTLITMRDDNTGYCYMWPASGYRDVEEGDNLYLKGAVKAHKVFNSVDQTVLTRCKLSPVL